MASYNIHTKIMRDPEEDRISRMKTDRWIFGFLLLAIALVPLLVGGYVKEVISPKISYIDLLSSGMKGDLFTHYKAIVLFIIAIIIVGLLLAKVFFMEGTIRKTKINIFLAIFALAIVLSTIFSPSISIALWGQYNRSDGAISYLSYLAIFFVAMNISYPKKAMEYVVYALYPFVFLNIILITMNFYGQDAMKYSFVEKMMSLFLPSGGSLGEGSQLLGTLNQWNFMSGMFAIMTVMYLAWAIIDKNKIRSIFNTIVAVIAFAVMLMSISTSGFVTVVAMSILLVVLAIRSNQVKQGLMVGVIFILVILPVFHVLAKEDPRVWNESIGFLIKKNPYIEEQPTASGTPLYDFSLENRAYAADSEFELPVLPERSIAAGSGRAYIWEKTFKMTMERPLFGYGMDTILYHFPHYNIDARAGMRSETSIVDKPHNMYIGILYGTGVIGLIGFVGLVFITVVSALKVVITKQQTMIAVFALGWLAFLLQALFNDTLPGTAGPMWTIAGIMMALLIANKEAEEITNGRND